MQTLEYRSAGSGTRRSPLVKVGGSLGIAASCIAMAVFLVELVGFGAAVMLAPLAMILAGVGLVLSVIGSVLSKHEGEEETQPLAALFCCTLGLLAAIIEWQTRT